jgi:hypothetical protein
VAGRRSVNINFVSSSERNAQGRCRGALALVVGLQHVVLELVSSVFSRTGLVGLLQDQPASAIVCGEIFGIYSCNRDLTETWVSKDPIIRN